MTVKEQFNIRIPAAARAIVLQIAKQEDMTIAEVARRLLEPAITLAKRYGFYEVSSELRRQANEALGLSTNTLSKKVARAKSRLPLKPTKSGPKMRFG